MKVGSQVICIDDQFSANQLTKLQSIPKNGNYYTIREIVEYANLNRVGVRLEEISNPPLPLNDEPHEPSFSIHRFRELDIPSPFEAEIKNMLTRELEPIETEDDGLLRKIYS